MPSKPILTLIFRDDRTSNHSIERLFSALEPHFREEFEVRKITMPCQPSGLVALCKNIRYARKQVKGIAHVTGDAQYLIPFLPRGKRILTVHDCGYLMKLRGLKKWLYKWIWFKLPCLTASRITVISDATREILEREVGDYNEKIVVAENCITLSTASDQAAAGSFNTCCPRILQIGSGRHKNLDSLIQAVDGLACELRIVGKLDAANRDALAERKISYKHEYAVSDQRLIEIFQECDLLFFASRHEGFGLPILEGQAARLPVITSTCYSMPHVAGKGAVLVDPESVDEIREAIQKICQDAAFREALIEAGSKNLKRFSSAVAAKRYLEVYRILHTD